MSNINYLIYEDINKYERTTPFDKFRNKIFNRSESSPQERIKEFIPTAFINNSRFNSPSVRIIPDRKDDMKARGKMRTADLNNNNNTAQKKYNDHNRWYLQNDHLDDASLRLRNYIQNKYN